MEVFNGVFDAVAYEFGKANLATENLGVDVKTYGHLPGAANDDFLALVAEAYRISPDMYLARNILLLLTALGLCGCSDVVTKEYPTYADAEADRLFERGWLPSIIPPSSYEIRVESNLDLNDAEGHFSFDPKDRLSFLSALRKMLVSEI